MVADADFLRNNRVPWTDLLITGLPLLASHVEGVAILERQLLLDRGVVNVCMAQEGGLAIHVALGVLHTPVELIMHAVLLIVIAFFLFRPRVSAYFRASLAQPASSRG